MAAHSAGAVHGACSRRSYWRCTCSAVLRSHDRLTAVLTDISTAPSQNCQRYRRCNEDYVCRALRAHGVGRHYLRGLCVPIAHAASLHAERIAVSHVLYRSRTGFKRFARVAFNGGFALTANFRTDSLISRLLHVTWMTATLPAICELIDLVLYKVKIDTGNSSLNSPTGGRLTYIERQ